MPDPITPRRSVLYVPGNNIRALEKAKTIPADAVILDLEDAVGDDAKEDSRRRVVEVVDNGAYHPREVVVRINGLGSTWYEDDLRAVAGSRAAGVLVPKIESAQEVQTIVADLEAAGAPSDLKVWVMVETPVAFLRSEEIAGASDRLAVLVAGTNDLVNDLHALYRPGRAPILTALSLAVLGARAAQKSILDGVFNDIKNTDGFIAEATQGREMGFDGKTVVHPAQVAPANEIFGPSTTEVEYAQTVVAAYEEGQAAGNSVVTVEGRMIESLHVRDAHRILDLAARIESLAAASGS